MNKKRVLTHNYVCFAINGYKEDLLQWINKTVVFFKESGFILKRVLFDRVLNNNSRMYSYSLSRFFEYSFKECGLRWWNLYCNKDSIIGKFRHIYKMNLLSMNHLQIKIGDKLLPDWVKENNYGGIIKISPQNWLWTINMAKQTEIAKILYNHQLLVGVD